MDGNGSAADLWPGSPLISLGGRVYTRTMYSVQLGRCGYIGCHSGKWGGISGQRKTVGPPLGHSVALWDTDEHSLAVAPGNFPRSLVLELVCRVHFLPSVVFLAPIRGPPRVGALPQPPCGSSVPVLLHPHRAPSRLLGATARRAILSCFFSSSSLLFGLSWVVFLPLPGA